jgi:hypothetical protein
MPIATTVAVALLTLSLTAAQAAVEPGEAPQGSELEQRLITAEARAALVERQLADLQRSVALHTDQRQRLAQLEGRWRLAFWAVVGLSLALSIVGAMAAIARRRELGATRYARSMAHELEEKRRSGLLERQESARRIVDLEARVRQLEAQPGVPRSA